MIIGGTQHASDGDIIDLLSDTFIKNPSTH